VRSAAFYIFFCLVLIRQPSYSRYRLIIYVIPHAMIFFFFEMLYISQEIHLLGTV
jgi:hypothetical protein